MQNRRMSRLYLDRDLGDDRARLTERETKYLGSVLRLRRGDRVLAFNGRGDERYAEVTSLAKSGGELALKERAEPVPESALALTLIQALPKMDAMDLVVQKATEIGVRALWPVRSDHSVVKLDAERAEKRAGHWQRVAQSACEQCGRHRPLDIAPFASLDDALASVPEASVKLVLEPRTGASVPAGDVPDGEVFLLVGPEGGFSDAELARIGEHGFTRVRLGPRTLRAETAAVVACGLLQALWGDLR